MLAHPLAMLALVHCYVFASWRGVHVLALGAWFLVNAQAVDGVPDDPTFVEKDKCRTSLLRILKVLCFSWR